MKLRTEIGPISKLPKIELGDQIITTGSCFSQNIGDHLKANKFTCLSNPFGTIYDPLSISRLLSYALNNTRPPASSYVESDGVWKNLHLHSSFSDQNKVELASKIETKLSDVREFIKSAQWLIITYGTAFVYRHINSNSPVANCQKRPTVEFSKQLLTLEQLDSDFSNLHRVLAEANPALKIIITVSPVRHLRDGIAENSLSKSLLRVLATKIESEYTNAHYYPAFEIMQDDLRDYRFYKEDMIHPTEQAIDYIWNHFTDSFFSSDSQTFIKKWQKTRSALSHKAFNPSSQEHQKFLKQLLVSLDEINVRADVSEEIALVKGQIL